MLIAVTILPISLDLFIYTKFVQVFSHPLPLVPFNVYQKDFFL